MNSESDNTRQLLETTARRLLAFQEYVSDLRKEVATGELDPRGLTVAGCHTSHAELLFLIALAREQGASFAPYTTIDRVEERTRELAGERDRLLEELGTERANQSLVTGLETYISSYSIGIRAMIRSWEELPSDEYEEFALEDQLADLMILRERDLVDLLLDFTLVETIANDLIKQMSESDELLWKQGSILFGPLIRAGIFQRGRRFEPRKHWWHYLDEDKEI